MRVDFSPYKRSDLSSQGFTLVELLATLVIIGILASVAWPNYQRHVLKSHRSDAINGLNDLLQAQEDFYLTNRTYTTDLKNLGYSVSSAADSDNGRYKLTASSCTLLTGETTTASLRRCIQLEASAQGKQTSDENGNGGSLTLNSLGEKSGW